MKENQLLGLIEEGRFDELENCWFEEMESGQSNVQEFLQVAKALGRQKEKERAGLLLGLLAEQLLENEDWSAGLQVLKEIARHSHEPARFEELKTQVRDVLSRLYHKSPSFQQILRHYHYEEIHRPEELTSNLESIEWWLSHDVGQIFYQGGYGTGIVTEINLNLGLIRLNFETKKDVSVQKGDRELLSLPEGHILREKVESPQSLRQKAMEDPGAILGRLLQSLSGPMNVAEIRECLRELIPAEQWPRWWSAARRHPQVVVSGKGTQATYEWSDSTSAAEDSLKKAFEAADIRVRMDMARQHSGRKELAAYFSELLIQDAKRAYNEDQSGLALELLELLTRWHTDPGYSAMDVVRKTDPGRLLKSIGNFAVKLKILDMLRQTFPDGWPAIFSDAFFYEENPRVLSALFETLHRTDPAFAGVLLARAVANPWIHPAAFTWICQSTATEGLSSDSDRVGWKLDGKFLLILLRTIDEPQFSHHRNKLKKAMEDGLLFYILDKSIELEDAQKAIEILDHSIFIEDYRRERWKNAIQMRFPEMRKKEDVLFSTKEALERKRAELENLINVELPKNRKAVGEAAALGDLSENFEYKAARERQDYLINRVAQLQNDLKMVRVLEPELVDCSQVRPGTKVTLSRPEKRNVITILGPWDSNPKDGIYSYQSPMGMSLLGKTIGEEVAWNDERWTIERIDPWA